MDTRARISAFVICCNEERNIERCLRSLTWCDELIVIDSGSTDRTLEIARQFTPRIISRQWPGFVAQKAFGLSQCSFEWVLNIDADEECSPELQARIEEILRTPDTQMAGYEISRVVFYLNRWWRRGGWYPEYRLRLLRRERARWGGADPHEHAIVDGKTGRIDAPIHHYTYRDISAHITTINNFSSVGAQSLFAKGRRASRIALVTRPLARFVKFFILKRGFLEGSPGLMVAVFESFAVYLKYQKLRRLWQEHDEGRRS